MKYTTEEFYFNIREIRLPEGKDFVFLNHYKFHLEGPVIVINDDPFAPLSDLRKIVSPTFTTQADKVVPETKTINGILYANAKNYLCLTLNTTIEVEKTGHYLFRVPDFGAPVDDRMFPLDKYVEMNFFRSFTGEKTVGDLYESFWFEPLKKVLPYRLYLPTYYDSGKALKLMLILHGGGSTPDEGFYVSNNMVQYYAEKLGYIVVGVDGAVFNSTYGCAIPPEGMPGAMLDYSNPENPMNHPAEILDAFKKSEDSVTTLIEMLLKQYNISKDHIFLTGNSMGGMGTFYYASEHPEIFRAVAPASAVPAADFFHFEKLKNVPTLFIAGTEDDHGYNHLYDGYVAAKNAGAAITFLPVGGGLHGDCWPKSLKEIYDFFESI